MAIRARYTRQMPWVGSETQGDLINMNADDRGISKAEVMREAFDWVYGLKGGELKPGDTLEAALARGQALLATVPHEVSAGA